MDPGLSVQEAALQLGLNEKTVRHQIQLGKLPAVKVSRPQGYTWRIYPDGVPAQVDADFRDVDSPPTQVGVQVAPGPPYMEPGAKDPELIRLVEKLHGENSQLAGQVGFLQARLQSAEERIKLLEPPKASEPISRVAWWQRWFRQAK
jgi:excisionase family DNA binding protein